MCHTGACLCVYVFAWVPRGYERFERYHQGDTNGASCNFYPLCIYLSCLNILLVHRLCHYFFLIKCNYIYLGERRNGGGEGQKEGHKLVRGLTAYLRRCLFGSAFSIHTPMLRELTGPSVSCKTVLCHDKNILFSHYSKGCTCLSRLDLHLEVHSF